MQIVHFVESTDVRTSGSSRFALDAARLMADAGHPSTVLTLDASSAPHAWLGNRMGTDTTAPLNANLPLVRHIGSSKLGASVLSAEAMRDIRATLKNADVVHLHNLWSIATLQVAAACRAMGVPYVISAHGELDDASMSRGDLKKKLFMRLGGRTVVDRAARVHCAATTEANHSRQHIAKGREFVAPYLTNLSAFETLPGLDAAQRELACVRQAKAAGTPVIVFSAPITAAHGVDLLIEAAAQLRDAGEHACFVVAGEGPQRDVDRLKKLAAKQRVCDRVHFVGAVTGDVSTSLLQNADLVVLPTSHENDCNMLLQAMACGTPVLTTRGADLCKEIGASGGGVIIEQTSSALSERMSALLADRAGLRTMGQQARAWVFGNFSDAVLASRYVQLYQTALGKDTQVELKPLRLPSLQRLQSVAATL